MCRCATFFKIDFSDPLRLRSGLRLITLGRNDKWRIAAALKYDEDQAEYISQSRYEYNGLGRVSDANEVVLDEAARFIRYG